MQDATIYTIAQKAGCSASTVSRVINNYPYVKKATRSRVLKLLQEYNYVPNETARSLVNKATRMIGILISDVRTTHHTNAIYYLENEFSKNGYTSMICNTGADPDGMASKIQLFSQRKIDGLVMIGSVYQNEAVRNAINTFLPDIPVMLINGYLEGNNIYGIISDETDGIYKCVKLLSETGKKNPAIIVDYMTPSTKLKIEGYKNGIKDFCPDAEAIVIVNSNRSEIYNETVNLLKKHPKTDSILYSEDFLALIGLQAIHDLGFSVPERVAVTGVNNSKFSEISIPPLTSLDNMLYDQSVTAVRNMLAVFKGERVSKKLMICSEVIKRQST